MKLVTIWQTYGPYHLARVRALEEEFGPNCVMCFSHCDKDETTYPFFNLAPENHQVITKGDASEIRFFNAIWNTYLLLKRECPDLVLTCGYERPETFGALLYARTSGKRVILMLENQHNDRKRLRVKESVKSTYLKLFDGYIYGGNTHREYLRILHVPTGRETYGYNCVDNDWIAIESDKARLTGTPLAQFKNYFLCVARLVEKKNLPRLIGAYHLYRNSLGTEEPWGLILVGDGEEKRFLEFQIDELGLRGSICLAGRIDKFADVVNYHAHARALVLASHIDEGWGLVVNEAMAAARPVLVSQQCGCASSLVENGKNGFTFDGRIPEQLASYMLWMHENEDKLEHMGTYSRQLIQKFSPATFAENVQALYRKSIEV